MPLEPRVYKLPFHGEVDDAEEEKSWGTYVGGTDGGWIGVIYRN
jgi:hypothetical protein